MTRRHVLKLTLALPAILPAQAGFALITKKDNSHSVTKTQIKNLLLGLGANWEGGGKIRLLLGPVGEPARIAALKYFAGMTEADYNKNVIHLNFVGHGDALPTTLLSTTAVRQLAQNVAGTVGVIPPGEVTDAVNAIPVA